MVSITEKVAVEIVAGFRASENVADTALFKETPVAFNVGTVDDTVGDVLSGAGPVVKLQT